MVGIITKLLGVLGTSVGKKLASYVATNGVTKLTKNIFTSLTGEKATKGNLEIFQELAKAVSTDNSGQAAQTEEPIWKQKRKAKKYYQAMKEVYADTPKELGLKLGGRALTEGANALGNIAVNNANKLASAILNWGTRNYGQDFYTRFGKPNSVVEAENKANELLTNGYNKQEIANAVRNVAGQTLADYSSTLDSTRTMSQAHSSNAPAAMYDYAKSQAVSKRQGSSAGKNGNK